MWNVEIRIDYWIVGYLDGWKNALFVNLSFPIAIGIKIFTNN